MFVLCDGRSRRRIFYDRGRASFSRRCNFFVLFLMVFLSLLSSVLLWIKIFFSLCWMFFLLYFLILWMSFAFRDRRFGFAFSSSFSRDVFAFLL